MSSQPFEVDDLDPARREPVQKVGLGGTGIAVQQDQPMRKWLIIKHIMHKTAKGLIAARDGIGPPADLSEDRGNRTGPLPAAPAMNQRTPAAIAIRQRGFKVMRDVAGDEGGADLAGGEGRDLLVNRADPGAFLVGQGGQVERAGDMILGKFGRRADVDHVIEPVRKKP